MQSEQYRNNMILIVGDCIAHIGSLFTFHEGTNKTGQLLLDSTLENNLMITNTKFQKKKRQILVIHLRHEWPKIILVNKKWKTS